MFLFVRSLPLLTALLVVFVGKWQFEWWQSYPWLFACSSIVFFVSAFFIGYRRLAWREWTKLVPSYLTFLIAGGAALLVESGTQQWLMMVVMAGISYIALELLFLLSYEPAKYPIHGLSRFNLAIIPLGVFFLSLLLSGLQVFLRFPYWLTPILCVIYGIISFASTSHHAAEPDQERRWAMIGGFVGLHVGLLAMVLPLDVVSTGVICALLFALPLRARRYSHEPKPKYRQAVSESFAFASCLALMILLSRWA